MMDNLVAYKVASKTYVYSVLLSTTLPRLIAREGKCAQKTYFQILKWILTRGKQLTHVQTVENG